MVVVKAVALVGDLDLSGPEQRGKDQSQHVTVPTIGRATEALLQYRSPNASLYEQSCGPHQCGIVCLMRHQYRQVCVRHDVASGAAENRLPQPPRQTSHTKIGPRSFWQQQHRAPA